MAQSLFKYKSASDYAIEDLVNDRLWVTSLSKMNDPLEFGFYVDKTLSLSRIVEFQQWLLDEFACISLSTTRVCRRLWNYYTDGMNGMAIEYHDSTIRKALTSIGILPVHIDTTIPSKKTSKFERFASEGKVIYDGKKANLSEWYKAFSGLGGSGEFKPGEVVFHKDDSWSDEKEYRFAFRREYLGGNYLTGLSPKSIYIGYRMPKEKEDTIYSYCVDKRIPLFRYTPDFHSESSKKYYREELYSPNPTGSGSDENAVETTE